MEIYTLKEARKHFSEIVNKVSIGGEPILITKFGKPTALVTNVQSVQKSSKHRKKVLKEVAGMWKGRPDSDFVRTYRYEKPFD